MEEFLSFPFANESAVLGVEYLSRVSPNPSQQHGAAQQRKAIVRLDVQKRASHSSYL